MAKIEIEGVFHEWCAGCPAMRLMFEPLFAVPGDIYSDATVCEHYHLCAKIIPHIFGKVGDKDA